ncbi:MAG: hypothetical protein EOP05_17310, partial [Proteobacteria bacterium]
MKRLALILGAVAAVATTATAQAQDATEFKNGGEFRLRYENFLNKSAADESAREQHFDSRLKWNMNIRKGEKLQAYVGLIEFADGAVFSENDWQATPYAHEGLNAAFDTSFAMFNIYGVKQAEIGSGTAAPGTNDTEANYYLGTMDLKNMPEAIKMANVHLLAVTGGNAAATGIPADAVGGTAVAGANQNWQQAGFTVGGDVVGFMYKATA